jgi:hypothetical protein
MADTGDEERRAKQGILLELNGRVHEAAKRFESADSERDLWSFTCECGASDCRVSVSLTLAEYEALRAGGGTRARRRPRSAARREGARERARTARGFRRVAGPG